MLCHRFKHLQAESVFVVSDGNTSSQNQYTSITATLPECWEVNDANIILQSSDLTNFRIHKSILISSSKVFRDMFLLPQPTNDYELVDGLPAVHLSEDAETIRALITALYPIPLEIPASYERVLVVLGAAKRYDMSSAQSSIRAEAISRQLASSSLAKTQVFHSYTVAFSNRLSPEMESIAHLTLDYPLTFESLGSDLLLFKGPALPKLTHFRKMCRDNLVSCFLSFLDPCGGPSRIWISCPRSEVPPRMFTFGSMVPANNDPPTLPSWLHDLFTQEITNLNQYFTHPLIKPSRIREKYLAALLKHTPTQHDCPTCLMVHARDGERYCTELEQKLTQARTSVSASSKSRLSLGEMDCT